MQNRGLIKFIAIIFALVSVYQLTFTFVANKYKNDAKAFAKGNNEKEVKYLDSIGKEKVFLNYFTFNEVKEKQINKGLDLEGGINVILQISVKDILKGLANNSTNPVFNKALAEAKKNQQGNQSYLDAFYDAFETASEGSGTKLSSPDVFGNRSLTESEGIKFDTPESKVKTVINKKVEESIESAFRVIRERIDKFGVTQPNIVKLGTTGRILVELPGAKDVDRAKKLLSSTAQLEFWEVYKPEEIGNYLFTVNEALKKSEKSSGAIAEVKDTTKKSKIEDLLVDKKPDSTKAKQEAGPLFSKIVSIGQQGSSVLAYFNVKDIETINGYFNKPEIRALLPSNFTDAKFLFGKPTGKELDIVEFYAIKGNRTNVPPMGGDVIVDAKDDFNQLGKPSVTMQMNGRGAQIWEELTGKAYTQKSAIAIVLDSTVYSAPGVTSGPIAGGRSEISGVFSIDETKDLANVLRAGKLPAAAEIVQSEVVGPSLGQKAIDNGLLSSIVGLLLVSIWMLVYYGKAGWYANIALVVNLLFYLASWQTLVLF